MPKRKIGAVAVFALVGAMLVGCGAGGGTPGPQASPADPSASGTVLAVAALHDWMRRPGLAQERIFTLRRDGSAKQETELFGPVDMPTGSAQLAGKQTLINQTANTQGGVTAIESQSSCYLSVSDSPTVPTTESWSSARVDFVSTPAGPHTVWWLALDALDSVTVDGPSSVDGISAIEYSGRVDLSRVPGIPASALRSPFFAAAGTTWATIDVYVDLGTGSLLRVSYRGGMPLSVDASPTPGATLGYEVDFSGFGIPATNSPSPTPTRDVTPGSGADTMCALALT